jgi:plasmid stabilization system protein ParE
MKMPEARLEYTERARRDMRRLRHFLRRQPGSRPMARVRDILNAVRFVQAHPKLHRVEGLSLKGLELRRRQAGQFTVVYSYFEPSECDPQGFVSVRAVRHGREEDTLYGVEESRATQEPRQPSSLRLE